MSDKRRAILRLDGPDIPQDMIEVPSTGFIIGRLDTNELALKHSKISRQHVRLELIEGGLSVEDLGSSNGTYVGDKRLEPRSPEAIELGQIIRIGPFTLTFEDIREIEDKPQLPATEMLKKDISSPLAPPTVKSNEDTIPPIGLDTVAPLQPLMPPPSLIADVAASPPRAGEIYVPPSPPPPQIPQDRDLTSPNGKPPQEPVVIGLAPKSNYLNYLPGIFREDTFLGRFLLIPESINMPIEWLIDNFEMYLQPQHAPETFLHWYASWFDLYIPQQMPFERKQQFVKEIADLYPTRGTRSSLARHLELVFGVKPVIEEPDDKPATFTVVLNLGTSGDTELNREIAKHVIESQRPAHTSYVLTIR